MDRYNRGVNKMNLIKKMFTKKCDVRKRIDIELKKFNGDIKTPIEYCLYCEGYGEYQGDLGDMKKCKYYPRGKA